MHYGNINYTVARVWIKARYLRAYLQFDSSEWDENREKLEKKKETKRFAFDCSSILSINIHLLQTTSNIFNVSSARKSQVFDGSVTA